MDTLKYSAIALSVAISLLPAPASADLTRKQIRAIVRQEIGKAILGNGAGPAGSPGSPGPAGPQGAPGPGVDAPGSPEPTVSPAESDSSFRFAFVWADGTIDQIQSRGITQENISVSDVGTEGGEGCPCRLYVFDNFGNGSLLGAQVTIQRSDGEFVGTAVGLGAVGVYVADSLVSKGVGFYILIY